MSGSWAPYADLDPDSDGWDGIQPDIVGETLIGQIIPHPNLHTGVVAADGDDVLAGSKRAAAEVSAPTPIAPQTAA